MPPDRALLGFGLEGINRFGDEGFEVDLGSPEFGPAHPGKGQEIIDELAHLAGRVGNGLEVAPGLGVQVGAEVFAEEIDEAVGVAERRPEVMGDGVAEGLQFVVRGLELLSVVLYLAGQVLDLFLGQALLGDIARRGIDELLFQDGRGAPEQPAVGAVAGAVSILERDGVFPAIQLRGLGQSGGAIVGMDAVGGTIEKFGIMDHVPREYSMALGAGETIWTESSYKYSRDEPFSMARQTGFRCTAQWIDQEWRFADNLWIAE